MSAFTTDFSLLSALVALLSAVEATGVCVPLFVAAATGAELSLLLTVFSAA